MRSRYRIVETDGVHFLTCTVVEWIPAFIGKDTCDMVVATFENIRQTKGLKLYAYVIMENHLHVVASAPDLRDAMQGFKSFTAREVIRLSRQAGREWLLNQFVYYKRRERVDSKFQVWQQGHHPQLIQGEAMLRQKIEYIHNNPVRRGWVELPEHWRYSSARNYLLGDETIIRMDEWPG